MPQKAVLLPSLRVRCKAALRVYHTHTHRYRLCAPLIVDGAEGVVKTMGIMDEHLLSKEEFDASCTRVCFNDIKVRARIPRYALIPRHASMAQLVLPCLFCTRMPAA